MKHTLGYILIALLIGALVSCSTSPLAGNSSEITNGYVVGSIINIDGSPASNTVVRLVPADYDPVKGPPLPESLIDTTNQYGEYSFTISDTGNFNIQAVHLSERTRLLTQGIVIDNQKDTIVLPDDTLKEPGVIKIFLPDTIDTTGAYLYIEGTTIFENLAKSVVDSEGLSIIIDSVPEAEIPGLHYDKINNPANPLLLSDTLQVTSNDTFVTEAFVFWINYTQTNSGLPGGVILDIYKAYGETMWFATNAEGVAVFNGTGWAVYDTNNSQIPSNIVHEVIRDNAGLMWFATQGGVASFDGITWTTYTADNSDMPGNFATIIDFDSKGIIWISCFR